MGREDPDEVFEFDLEQKKQERQNIGTGGGWKVNKEILIQIITISPKSK